MSDKQQRTPPNDPWAITLTYRHEQPRWYGADDALETRRISADVEGEAGGHAHVGDMSITLVDLYQTHDPFALLDGEDAELGRIAEVLFDAGDGHLDPDLDEQLESVGDRILVLHSVQLTPTMAGLRSRSTARRRSDQETVWRRQGRRLLPGPARRRQ